MEPYLTEEQQVEQLKRLWNEYGNLISTVLLSIAVIVVGYNAWQSHTTQQRQQASALYQAVQQSVQANDESGIAANAGMLIQRYPHSSYAYLADLQLAQQSVAKNDLQKAQGYLMSVVAGAKEPALTGLANLRLAQIFLAQDKADLALQTLSQFPQTVYPALVDELRGDIYVKQQQLDKARTAYEQAIALETNNQHQQLLSMKLASLGIHS